MADKNSKQSPLIVNRKEKKKNLAQGKKRPQAKSTRPK